MSSTADEDLIRDRLLVEERQLLRVVKKHAAWRNSLIKGQIPEASQCCADFLLDFNTYVQNLLRFQRIHDMSVREHTHWEEESQKIAAQIEEAKATIAKLEEELRAEELLVLNKKEYNRLAKDISLHKSRSELTQEIAELEQNIAELEQQDRNLDDQVLQRQLQIKRVLSAVDNASSDLTADEDVDMPDVDKSYNSRRGSSNNREHSSDYNTDGHTKRHVDERERRSGYHSNSRDNMSRDEHYHNSNRRRSINNTNETTNHSNGERRHSDNRGNHLTESRPQTAQQSSPSSSASANERHTTNSVSRSSSLDKVSESPEEKSAKEEPEKENENNQQPELSTWDHSHEDSPSTPVESPHSDDGRGADDDTVLGDEIVNDSDKPVDMMEEDTPKDMSEDMQGDINNSLHSDLQSNDGTSNDDPLATVNSPSVVDDTDDPLAINFINREDDDPLAVHASDDDDPMYGRNGDEYDDDETEKSETDDGQENGKRRSSDDDIENESGESMRKRRREDDNDQDEEMLIQNGDK